MTYPSGVGDKMSVPEDRQQAPPSLRNAVHLMCVGASVAFIGTIVTAAVSGRIKAEVFNAERKDRQGGGGYTLAQLHTVANLTFLGLLVAGIISVLLWLWMAWASNQVSGWSRICASVLFGLSTVEVFILRSWSSISVVFILLEWLVGLVVVVLLWRRATTAFIGAA